LSYMFKRRGLSSAGHVARMEDTTYAYKVCLGNFTWKTEVQIVG